LKEWLNKMPVAQRTPVRRSLPGKSGKVLNGNYSIAPKGKTKTAVAAKKG